MKVTKNGPYLVSGGVPLTEQLICVDAHGECTGWQEEKVYPVTETYALCRCGQSKTKPFCDGAHLKTGFDGAETATRQQYLDRARNIAGPTLRLTDAEGLCASAGFCQRAGSIWKLVERPDDPEATKEITRQACECPSGRLVVWDREGRAIEPDLPPSIGLVLDPDAGMTGPLWVRGGIPIESADGAIYEIRNRVTLCRCGKSSNKPFCDGSHLENESRV
ncbi:MAG: CDGSH iron-sulfur domain-containing protein [Chloroflexi bacterium]|nr:CDGSH iron-sulfur domain-containing protein [Chloroflexota bacterium]